MTKLVPKMLSRRLVISLPLGTATRNFIAPQVVQKLSLQSDWEIVFIVPSELMPAMQNAVPFEIFAYDFGNKPLIQRIAWKLLTTSIDILSASGTPTERYERRKKKLLAFSSKVGQTMTKVYPRLSVFIVGIFECVFRVSLKLKRPNLKDFTFRASDRYLATSAHLISEQYLIHLAKQSGAQFDAFVHSWDVPSSKAYYCYKPHTFFVPDKGVQEDLERFSFKNSTHGIKIVGSPRYVALNRSSNKSVLEDAKDTKKIEVLYATSQAAYFPNEVDFIKELALRFPHIIFVLRVHPQECPVRFQQISETNIVVEKKTAFVDNLPDNLNPLFETIDDFAEMLNKYDLVVCTASSMAFDAAIKGKKVAQLRLSNLPKFSVVENLYKTHHGQKLLETFCENVIDDYEDIETFLTSPSASGSAVLTELTDPSLIEKIWAPEN